MTRHIRPLTPLEIEAVLGVAGDALAEETLQGDRRLIAAFERGTAKLRGEDPDIVPSDPQWLAIAAAHAATEASTELLRYAREGDHGHTMFDHMVEPIEKFADALKMALEALPAAEIDGERKQLLRALSRYLEGWA
ncbi:hypothetical protein SAMN05444678_102228 [Sphingomonas sp. YR710]|uniref:hypothetical protein n=1 Tax=Sphingomonas sp. YR710 TaxID=1882773 RepID=UPI00088C423D|nr:hypothetical protein [Sphingomonas sp. YR710]SDC29705.1 hypothetical protein SAMN05444678_102228 [Sphingomonas sp. YR710]